MIIKYFDTRSRTASGCIDYLLGRERDRVGASVLFGNEDLTLGVIEGSKLKNKHGCGCISITGKGFDPEFIHTIIKSFQLALGVGLLENQVNWLWVLHTDKENTELNFVVPFIDLLTGKNLVLFNKKTDHYLISSFRDFFDAEFNLNSPLDPINVKSLRLSKGLTKEKKASQISFHSCVEEGIKDSVIKNRKDLAIFFSINSFNIVSVNKKSIIVEDQETGEFYSFKGLIYEEDFSFSVKFQEELLQSSIVFRANRKQRKEKAYANLEHAISLKRNRNSRYAAAPEYICEQIKIAEQEVLKAKQYYLLPVDVPEQLVPPHAFEDMAEATTDFSSCDEDMVSLDEAESFNPDDFDDSCSP